MIELKGVTRRYKMGDELIYALNAVDLKIEKGEFIAIIGPSGSGKSTLANIIGGLDRPDSGQVTVDDIDLMKTSDNELSHYRNKKVGFVFQSFNLQPNYSAVENVAVPLLFAKMSKSARRKRAEECLRAVGLETRMKHKPTELSGGQRQRVAIARALANNPEIIIADEPTGNLDSKKGDEIMDLMKKLNKDMGVTLIIITHDPDLAKQAGRVISIHDGSLH